MKRLVSIVSLVVAFSLLSWAQPKYIFYMIGDGMGLNQIQAAELYMAELNGQIGRVPLCMSQFPVMGMASTYSESNSITDSSAAGTCLASGKKTKNGTLGLTTDNKHPMTIAELLHKNGWAVGIMTSVSIDHATPGAFYAQVSGRDDYYVIGQQLAASGFEFFGGGTFYKPNDPNDSRQPNLYDLCEKSGYIFCHGLKEMTNYMDKEKAILIQSHEGKDKNAKGEGRIPYAIDRKPGDLTLHEITSSAIEFLFKKDRPFFMMVEGGQIDWACHSNDAATAIQEVMDFDASIQEAFRFYKEHPDETLIIVTADHETGGMALGNKKYTLDLQLLKNQHCSVNALSDKLKAMQKQYGKKLKYEQVKALLQESMGLYAKVEVTKEEDVELRNLYKQMIHNHGKDAKNMYASIDGLADKAMRLLNKKAHIGWTTTSHSAAAVPVFAIGKGAERFTGFMDNSDIMPTLLEVAGYKYE